MTNLILVAYCVLAPVVIPNSNEAVVIHMSAACEYQFPSYLTFFGGMSPESRDGVLVCTRDDPDLDQLMCRYHPPLPAGELRVP